MGELTGSKRKAAIVRKPAKAKACNHDTVTIAWHPETGHELSRRCSVTFGCGMQLSLGVDNDTPAEVQVEIRAAELEYDRINQLVGERWGWEEHQGNDDVIDNDIHWAGWLHRELATHKGRETRDADAWPWDITRPVAGQYEEQIRIHQDVVAALAETDARINEQTRHDVAASVARHADLPSASQLRAKQCPVTRCTLAGICVESPCSSYRRDPPTDPSTKFSGQLQQVTVPVTLPTVDHRGMIRARYPADQCPDPETCATCGDVPADLQDLPPPTFGEAGVLAARDAEPDCRDDDDDPLTPAQRAEVTRILSDVPSDEPLAMSDPGGPTKEDADGNPYCEPAGNA